LTFVVEPSPTAATAGEFSRSTTSAPRSTASCHHPARRTPRIRVWAEPDRWDKKKTRPLSMSWWLSKPVQLYMHEQTLFDGDKPMVGHRNRDDIVAVLKGLNKEPGRIGPG
jgi:hypothetical protein